jgi:hypothetical protein
MIFTKENYDMKICEICGQKFNKAKVDLIYNVCSPSCFDRYMHMIQNQFMNHTRNV